MDQTPPPPHVFIFPLPLQGPIKCMLKLAELLCLAGVHVTFLNTDHNHRRLLRHTAVQTRFSAYPQFRFDTISDGLPDDHPRSGDRFMDLFDSLEAVSKPLMREMLFSYCRSGDARWPVTCVIADGALTFALEVAEDVGIPLIYFDTISPCGLWSYFCIPKMIDAGEMPFKGNDLDAPIQSVPGMEGFLRQRDLPTFCRVRDMNDRVIQLVMKEAQEVKRSRGLILNTFEELEEPVLSHMRFLYPNLYPIGPLHTHLKTRLGAEPTPPLASSNSLWHEDLSCIAWLDAQPLKSVIYVSIGSLAMMTRDQLVEFWHGLVNSGHRFLWVRRPNSIPGGDWEGQIPEELLVATKERGCIVSWAPQEEVLAHPAVGGFLTHSGWNSTLESMIEAVPMLCWPYFVDQQVNSRFVNEVWKLGIDMKDTCDRVRIEKMVKDLMDVRRDEFVQSAERWAKLAKQSVSEGGSSFCNLKCLIEDIKLMV
ncbi:7-deoxyloganetic acid glucosyltransferase [Actinidia chinensis var. chinensis]|uniref:Glycosyltransferase n=1 Tax=Actinidia chinensis var. chinensis TaxID=1590841 RepID=A0A2R6PLM7_ACTCC|nr:7-deoxyloganetic acid glucosyltransferase [Actinidia chinensis var. chinensis]